MERVERGTVAEYRSGPLLVVVAAILLTAVLAAAGSSAALVAPVAAGAAVLAVGHARILSWRSQIVMLLALILFMPIRQYTFALHLPFELEPYRVFVVLLAAGWVASLLVDRRVRFRASGLEAPLALLGVAIVGSIVVNSATIAHHDLSVDVAKKLTFWASFVVVFYFLSSVVRESDVEFFIRFLVVGAAVLGALAVVEWRTGYNVFTHFDRIIPVLTPVDSSLDTFRAGLNRAYASAQHPIAFGAAMVLILPFSAVLAYRRRTPLWIGCTVLIVMGSLASVSRTSFIMIAVVAVTLAILRPVAARQALPFLLPLAIAVQIIMPGTFATVKAAFLPQQGLVAEQANQQVGSGRIASLGPAIDHASLRPLLGQGFGTRIVDEGPKNNAFILDDEWLSTLLELGLVGAFAWIWLFKRFCSRSGRAAKRDDSERGWLLAAFTASIASFAVGMAFFDAFSFIQLTVLMIILLALGSVLLRSETT
jgi:O-antigen ligase